MAARLDFYYRQRVTEAELDLAFALLEKADHNLAADIGVYGVVTGAVPTQHAPIADLSIDLSAPGCGYDRVGQRLFFGTGQTVHLATDSTGIPTEVAASTHERWLGVFLRFKRLLSDPRTDGNSQQVFFRQDESFELVVRQGPQAAIGSAPKVPLVDDELLLCDVGRTAGQMQILNADIDTSRRQAFVFAHGNAVGIVAGLWTVLSKAATTVQAALDSVDQLLAGHFAATAHRHRAQDVDYAPHGFLAASNVRAALDELVDDLSSSNPGSPGAGRVGADAIPGTPYTMPEGSVDAQLSQLLAWLNTHVGALANAHRASAIQATPHAFVAGTSVQAQLQEMAADLQSQAAPASGASLVGNDAVAGAPYQLDAGSVREQLRTIVADLNTHAESDDHDARYLREMFRATERVDAGQRMLMATLDDFPQVVERAYNYIAPNGQPESAQMIQGNLSSEIRCWMTKVDTPSGYACELWVHNGSSSNLFITVGAYCVG
ncbi:MAG: hypothetical protein MUF54_15510 [Polyangiaceae bacterium]|nr:hypothetical protein [Polyangiaceae bacterium]